MVYNYTDTSDPPDLESFKLNLVQECLRRSFYQNEPKKIYNMLKLPLIIAPSVLGKQVNTDIKESIDFILTNNLDLFKIQKVSKTSLCLSQSLSLCPYPFNQPNPFVPIPLCLSLYGSVLDMDFCTPPSPLPPAQFEA